MKTGLSPRTVARHKKILKEGSEKLRREVISGQKSPATAEHQINLEKIHTNPIPLPDGKYDVIVCDAPYAYNYEAEGAPCYPTLTEYEIINLKDKRGCPVTNAFARDAVTFFWAPMPKLEEALRIIKAWGFSYKTSVVWSKEKEGRSQQGPGHYVVGMCELVLVATRGKPGVPSPKNRLQGLLRAAKTRVHSQKPEMLQHWIQKAYPTIKQSNIYASDNEDDRPDSDWTVEDYKVVTNWDSIQHNGWHLPGTQDPHYWCGIWNTMGCLHKEDHHIHKKKIFVKRYQRSCFRASCQTCYTKWIGRQANTGTRRIEKYSKQEKIRPIHIVLSVSAWDYNLDYKLMKKKARKILSEIKIRGGCMVFHPFRFNKRIRCWYYSPHFHVIGFGFVPTGSIADTYHQNGWPIKYLGVRKSAFATFYYILSHCGKNSKFHTVCWFGGLSYCKVTFAKEPYHNRCPSCGRKLIEIYYKGSNNPLCMTGIFEGFIDPGGWYPVKTPVSSDIQSTVPIIRPFTKN